MHSTNAYQKKVIFDKWIPCGALKKSRSFGASRHGVESQLCHFTSQSLYFLICEIGIIMSIHLRRLLGG